MPVGDPVIARKLKQRNGQPLLYKGTQTKAEYLCTEYKHAESTFA